MKLTTEQIEKILSEAPEGATHHDNMTTWKYKNLERGTFLMSDGTGYKINESYPGETIKSLDDLREILALRKEVERLRGKLSEVSKVLGGAHSAAEWPTNYCISEIEGSLNIDGFLKGEVK